MTPPVATRFRLARNLDGLPFAWRMGPAEAVAARDRVRAALPAFRGVRPARDRAARLACGLRPRPPEGPAPELWRRGERAALVGAVDHLLLQWIRPGPPSPPAVRAALALAAAVDRREAWARVPGWGRVTASPADAGRAGVRAVFVLTLPGLARARLARAALAGAARAGLVFASDGRPAGWLGVPARPVDVDRPARLADAADALARLAAEELRRR